MAIAIADQRLAPELGNEPQLIANELWKENVESLRSVNRDLPSERFHFENVDCLAFSNAELIKAVECYRFQACEHSDWEGSTSDMLTENLMIALALPFIKIPNALAKVRSEVEKIEGFQDADWRLDGSPVELLGKPEISCNHTNTQDKNK